jgi:hypothetical protein
MQFPVIYSSGVFQKRVASVGSDQVIDHTFRQAPMSVSNHWAIIQFERPLHGHCHPRLAVVVFGYQ